MTEPPTGTPLLHDGRVPASPAELLDYLTVLGITHHTEKHAPVFTVSESKALHGDLPGGHTKNLFLRNKRGDMWLVTCDEDREVPLDWLAARLGARRFSFARPERLMRYLGVIPGAVTPFAVINDRAGAVRVAVDASLLRHEILNLHPLDNAMTSVIGARDLVRFLHAAAHPPEIIEFDE